MSIKIKLKIFLQLNYTEPRSFATIQFPINEDKEPNKSTEL